MNTPENVPNNCEDIVKARKVAMDMACDAAFRGDSLAGSLMALEHYAEPYFLGLDEDEDDSDMDVWP